MATKKEPTKKVLDVSKPKKRVATAANTPAAPAPQLIIPKRSIIPVTDAASAGTDEPVEHKRVKIGLNPMSTDSAPAQPAAASTPETPTPAPAAPEAPAQATPDTPAPDKAQDTDNAKPTDEDHHVRKALENAKREEELQGYIDTREFFVPINAVARKRSVRVSLLLICVELMLGLFLVNLMLDAGVIQLLEKIPHTNFFHLQ